MIRWFSERRGLSSATSSLDAWRLRIEPLLAARAAVTGYCCACDRIVELRVGPETAGEWLNLRESFLCDGCGLTGRGRSMLTMLRDAIGDRQPRTLLLEQVTPFFARLQREFPFVRGSEYVGDEVAPGAVCDVGGVAVQHENMMELSYGTGSLDIIFHGDVLEHVPDFRAGLRECCRVLAVGGQMLFSVPFFALEEHLVRAEVVDGRLVHHLEPGYHGNPMSSEGSLVFTHHGWPLLDDLREAGFRGAEVGLLYDPFQGIVSSNNPYPEGHMWPVMFRATR